MATTATSTTVAILTPIGRGAVAVIAVDGPQAVELVEHFFTPRRGGRLADFPVGRIVYGQWGRDPGEDVIVHRRPEQVEVHCHGGTAAARRIVEDLMTVGALEQSWTDWIVRSESNSIRAAARTALAHATTERTAAILLDQYQGALETALHRILDLLESTGAEVETQVAAELQRLLDRAAVGLHLTQPWRVAIVGPPNVGKSSLMNALLGYDRAIVFDQPGTTRDVVTATTAFEGWPVQLSDTAGWRDSSDPLEAAGAERAQQQAATADCVLLVFDASQTWTAENRSLIESWPQAIIVMNKCDLLDADARVKILREVPGALLTCALTNEAINDVASALVARLVPVVLNSGDAVPFAAEQFASLQRAAESLRNRSIAAAREYLESLLK